MSDTDNVAVVHLPYFCRMVWPPASFSSSPTPAAGQIPVIDFSAIEHETIVIGRTTKCLGILFVIQSSIGPRDREDKKHIGSYNSIVRINMQRLTAYFWSTVIQAQFRDCPIAVVVEGADEDKTIIPMLPMILRWHYITDQDETRCIDYFTSSLDACMWLIAESTPSDVKRRKTPYFCDDINTFHT